MNQQNLPLEHEISNETAGEATGGRRAALKQSGLLLGAALFGGLAKTRTARAADNTTTATKQPGAMSGGMMPDNRMDEKMRARLMNVTAMTKRNEMGIPSTAVIKATTTHGAKEQNDIAILNYALALEYLEADYYTRAVQADNARSYLTGRVKEFARVLQRDETAHVQAVSDAIRALGGTPIEKPEFVFPADAFISPIGFLTLSSQLEETGVSAYLGQGANVRRTDVLNFAASIYGVEARHSGLLKHFLGDSNPHNMEMPLTMAEIGRKVKPFFANPQAMPASLMQS